VQEIYAYIERHTGRALTWLERLCRQPSISAQGVGLKDMAQLVAKVMREYGLNVELLSTEGGPPLVYGEIRGKGPHTLLFYNHYDVQPPDPLDEWTSPPFEPTRRDGKLFARGASDNKGDLPVRLEAIAALREVLGTLPLSIKFIVDGEEESGSPHFPAAVRRYKERLMADVCLSEGCGIDLKGTPSLVLGVKGLLYVELSAQAAQVDAHSAYAAVVPNPSWRLVQALSTLKGPDGRVALAGFYDAVRPLNAQEREALAAMPDESASLRQALGLETFIDGLEGYLWRERLYGAPTCNICGLTAGYAGPGAKTVLPAKARAKLDFRLVPDQDPQQVLGQLRAHLDRHGFTDILVQPIAAHIRPARTPVDDPWVQVAAQAAEAFYGRPPKISINSAGTAPMGSLVEEVVGALFFPPGGAGYEGSHIHAPDEHIRIADLTQATEMTALLLKRFGAVDDRHL
jgi:acetylornithine deacetylase/succinyl-diaminopimelate desuccinylase-like protein